MNVKLFMLLSLPACVIILCSTTALAEDGDVQLTLLAGTELTSGRYGGDVDIEDLYVPLTASAYYGRFAFRLTVPYLSVSAPEGTVIYGSSGEPLPGSGELTTESGLRDVIGSVTVYDVIYSQRFGLAMDLTGKVKLGTADEDKGLGSGENDYNVPGRTCFPRRRACL
jgi:hypothetical protein